MSCGNGLRFPRPGGLTTTSTTTAQQDVVALGVRAINCRRGWTPFGPPRLAGGGDDVRVGVRRETDLRMSERLHDDPGLDALGQEQGGAGVAKVMEVKAR
jgi:hypothetical protein